MLEKSTNPLVIVGFFGLTATVAYFFSLPEPWIAGIVILFFIFLIASHPSNGLLFILLTVPFFLGGSIRPYFWLTEVFVILLICVGTVAVLAKNERPHLPFAQIIGLLVITAFLSVPLDLKELSCEVWASSLGDMFSGWLAGHPKLGVYYFRELFNLITSVCIFYISANLFSQEDKNLTEKLPLAIVVLAFGVICFGLLLFYEAFPENPDQWHYLSLSIVGEHGGAPSGFAYNRQYFTQYLLLSLPFVLWLLVAKQRSNWQWWLGLTTLSLIVFCFAKSGQRTVILVLPICFLIGGVLVSWLFAEKKQRKWVWFSVIGLVMIIIGFIFLYAEKLLGRFSFALLSNDPRVYLWGSALSMFADSPILGVGLGRFHALFNEYPSTDIFLSWGKVGHATGTAHSFFFQTLAERGLAGVLLWGGFLIFLFRTSFRFLVSEQSVQKRYFVMAFIFSLIIWLLLGLLNNVTYIRIYEIYFWIVAGIIVAMSMAHVKKVHIRQSWLAGVGVCLFLAVCMQFYKAYDRPLAPDFEVGFHKWEEVSKGKVARWTQRRAVWNVKVEDNKMILPISAPLPGLDKNPQSVKINLSGWSQTLVLSNADWNRVEIPSTSLNGEYVKIQIETGYVFNPAKEGISADNRALGVMVGLPEWEHASITSHAD